MTVPYVPVEIASHESTRARPRSATLAVQPRRSVVAGAGGEDEDEGGEAEAAAAPPQLAPAPPGTEESKTLPPVRSPCKTSSECR